MAPYFSTFRNSKEVRNAKFEIPWAPRESVEPLALSPQTPWASPKVRSKCGHKPAKLRLWVPANPRGSRLKVILVLRPPTRTKTCRMRRTIRRTCLKTFLRMPLLARRRLNQTHRRRLHPISRHRSSKPQSKVKRPWCKQSRKSPAPLRRLRPPPPRQPQI